MKRRANGEGSIEHLPDGRCRASARVDGRRIKGPISPNPKAALAGLRAKLAGMAAPPPATTSSPLSTCAREKSADTALSPTTRDQWRYLADRLERDPIGQMLPEDVDGAELAAYAARQEGAPRTARNRIRMILQLLRAAGNPVQAKILGGRREKRPRILTPAEQSALIARVAGTGEVETMVRLALQCGLRRSEIAGLRHEDRDGDGILVQRAVVRTSGGISVKGTKTASSEGWVPLPADGSLDWIGSGAGYVLGGAEPRSPSLLDDRWRRLRRNAGLTDVGLHDLRRTYGMRLLESGVDVRTAAEMMRHDPSMLLGLYAASRRDLKRAAARRLAERTAPEMAPNPGLGNT